MFRRSAFTLFELMLALVIGLLMVTIAVPGISKMLRERALKESFEDFSTFVAATQRRAVTTRETQVLLWGDQGITRQDLAPVEKDAAEEPDRFAFAEDAVWTLQRPAALVKRPVLEWPFWPSGVCEPVIVSYRGPAGAWSAEFNPLTARGTLLDSSTPWKRSTTGRGRGFFLLEAKLAVAIFALGVLALGQCLNNCLLGVQAQRRMRVRGRPW